MVDEFELRRAPRDELTTTFRFLADKFDEVLEEEGSSYSFAVARDLDDADSYAETIVERTKAVGVLRAVCEDVADAMGFVDYDEAVWAVRGVVRQWHHIADSLLPTSRSAVRVRTLAEELRTVLDDPDLDLEMLPDLVSIASCEGDLVELALEWQRACEEESEEAFWNENEARASQSFLLLGGLKADLRRRGELGLDDELLLPGTEGGFQDGNHDD